MCGAGILKRSDEEEHPLRSSAVVNKRGRKQVEAAPPARTTRRRRAPVRTLTWWCSAKKMSRHSRSAGWNRGGRHRGGNLADTPEAAGGTLVKGSRWSRSTSYPTSRCHLERILEGAKRDDGVEASSVLSIGEIRERPGVPTGRLRGDAGGTHKLHGARLSPRGHTYMMRLVWRVHGASDQDVMQSILASRGRQEMGQMVNLFKIWFIFSLNLNFKFGSNLTNFSRSDACRHTYAAAR